MVTRLNETVVPPLLEVKNLYIRREEGVILNGLDWRVSSGEHWVILGPNGSGKSSLLSSLTGYLPPTAGSFHVLGKTFGRTDWRELRKSIGLVSTAIADRMDPGITVLEAVAGGRQALIGHPGGRMSPADRQRSLKILGQVGCRRLAGRSWATLSQGEQKRVLIARALMARFKVLFLDEPCAGLDPVAREVFLAFVERLGRRKDAPSIILVTHHVEEILPIFSRVLILKAGKVLATGPMKEALTAGNLKAAFGADIKLRRSADGRYRMSVMEEQKRLFSHKGHEATKKA
jgi:iron complex transport system ATP-binding protein